ncbi:MAG TPA: TIGR03118 family protein [Candidatus Dormibacteraeota bacterium]|nr:TIGR03118 family protein [Candidatus Dormibacteraeota bacterium]
MPSSVRRVLTLAVCCGLVLLFSGAAMAQSYSLTYLVSNLTGKASHTDPLLKNAWGLSYAPGGAFWVSDEADGWSTLYDGSGNPQTLQVIVPTASGSGFGSPTGMVYNGSSEFKISSWTSEFLFATLDGSVQGWSGFNPSATLVGAKQAGASYTGLAITSHSSGNTLYAADSANNKVDMYDGSFNLKGSFTDATIPPGFAPFGIQDISGQIYVTYASTTGGSGGYIDIFTESGTFVKRFAHGSPLNQPWGMAVAPKTFGTLSSTLLVSNNTATGTINAFNLTTGKFVGTVKNSAGKAISISGLWGIEFGGGSTLNGKTNQLFFTAGPSDTNGYFGVINLHK